MQQPQQQPREFWHHRGTFGASACLRCCCPVRCLWLLRLRPVVRPLAWSNEGPPQPTRAAFPRRQLLAQHTLGLLLRCRGPPGAALAVVQQLDGVSVQRPAGWTRELLAGGSRGCATAPTWTRSTLWQQEENKAGKGRHGTSPLRIASKA